MNRLSIREQDDAQKTALHFCYLCPPSYSPISLDMFANGVMDGLLNPFILNQRPVLPGSDKLKVMRGFHKVKLTERGCMSTWDKSSWFDMRSFSRYALRISVTPVSADVDSPTESGLPSKRTV